MAPLAIRSLIPGEDCVLLEECMERLSVVAQMRYEVSHVCNHSNEAGQLLFICDGGSFLLFPVSSSDMDACHQHCTLLQRMRPLGI